MGRIVASEFLSADGYIVGPNEDMKWVTDNFNEEMGKYAGDLMASMDAVLLGRVTYGIMSNAWPNLTEAQSPGADKMNHTPKYVLSNTISKAPWGKYAPATVIGGDVEPKVRALKQTSAKDVVVYGSAKAVQSLTRMSLIDEYHLLVHPVFLGGGKLLFGAMEGPTSLRLAGAQTFGNGVNLLRYVPSATAGNASSP